MRRKKLYGAINYVQQYQQFPNVRFLPNPVQQKVDLTGGMFVILVIADADSLFRDKQLYAEIKTSLNLCEPDILHGN